MRVFLVLGGVGFETKKNTLFFLFEKRRDFSFCSRARAPGIYISSFSRDSSRTFGLGGDFAKIATMAETLGAVWCIFDADGSGAIDRREFSMSDGLGATLAARVRGVFFFSFSLSLARVTNLMLLVLQLARGPAARGASVRDGGEARRVPARE